MGKIIKLASNSELKELSENYLNSWGSFEKSLESKYAFEDGFETAEEKFNQLPVKTLLKLIIRKIFSK